MDEFKLIVAGSRDFTDRTAIADAMNDLAHGIYAEQAISIVSGMARGVDRLAWEIARDAEVMCYEFPADWGTHGKSAGYIRNHAMGDFADGLLAFWDGKSRGTKDMIDYMLITKKKPVHLVRFDQSLVIKSFNI